MMALFDISWNRTVGDQVAWSESSARPLHSQAVKQSYKRRTPKDPLQFFQIKNASAWFKHVAKRESDMKIWVQESDNIQEHLLSSGWREPSCQEENLLPGRKRHSGIFPSPETKEEQQFKVWAVERKLTHRNIIKQSCFLRLLWQA